MKCFAVALMSLAIAATHAAESTPDSFPGAETFEFRQVKDAALRLHVFKPEGMQPGERRAAFVFFFGGGWNRGTPERSAGWARMAAQWGLVGIAPDYRTRDRFDTTPLDAVADARAAFHWIQAHAVELGLDPARIVVGGSSAGGHLALWTAIPATPPGSDPQHTATHPPAALVLLSAVSDTSSLAGYGRIRFGDHAAALSPLHQLPRRMPPTLAFHGDADPTVPYSQAVALQDKLVASGNSGELVTVPGGSHGFSTDLPEWKDKVRVKVQEFLRAQALLPPS
ncbi:MAG: alpha/beta hydrolase [Opitutus sp.]|nr:alpha/beta hydrolase [Opitutus sp.]